MLISISIDMESLTGFGGGVHPSSQGVGARTSHLAMGYRALQTYGLHTMATYKFIAKPANLHLYARNANTRGGRDESRPYRI